jgi:hypothetical protein
VASLEKRFLVVVGPSQLQIELQKRIAIHVAKERQSCILDRVSHGKTLERRTQDLVTMTTCLMAPLVGMTINWECWLILQWPCGPRGTSSPSLLLLECCGKLPGDRSCEMNRLIELNRLEVLCEYYRMRVKERVSVMMIVERETRRGDLSAEICLRDLAVAKFHPGMKFYLPQGFEIQGW